MKKLLIIATILIFSAEFLAQTELKFNKKIYNSFIDMRVGNGKKPSFWYCYGEVYTYPEGKLVAKMQGADMARFVRITDDSVVQISRKIFLYLDPKTNEPLPDSVVSHIKYPYQQISYVLADDKLRSWVTQGAGSQIQTIGPGTKTFARTMGSNLVFSAPLFLSFETPRGKYEAYENYDFVINKAAKKTKDKYQLLWNRYGDLPPFAGKTKGIIQLICHRVDSFDELSEPLKKYIREKATMWLDPPKDFDEIKKIQDGLIK